MEVTLAQEFCCYGYWNITGELKEKGWIINLGESIPANENSQITFWWQNYTDAFSAELHSILRSKAREALAEPGHGYQVRAHPRHRKKRTAVDGN
jgi:hypothetical protein